jgi:arylsulfatase A-like enzyme
MLLRYPERIKAGTVKEEMVLDTDIAPTLLDLAGVKVPEHMQGHSVMNLARGEATEWRKDWLYHFYEYPVPCYVQPHRGIRTERFKLIHYYQEPQKFELYDLQVDPGEIHNLYGIAEYAAVQSQLWKRLAELRQEVGDVDTPAAT